MSLIITLLVVAVVFGIVLSMVLTRFLYICQPNEVLVFSGGQRASVGRKVGYRIIKGGRALRIPLLETVDSMDLTNMPIEVAVQGAYSKGGIPVNVHGIANVKVAGEQPVLDNAIERFLGVDRGRIMAIAKDTLEGNLRGVLATLTPEELNEDKIKFAQSLLAEAEDDLRRLGLELDTLKIQDVSDDVGYLDSIGRKQSGNLIDQGGLAGAVRADHGMQLARPDLQRHVIGHAQAAEFLAQVLNAQHGVSHGASPAALPPRRSARRARTPRRARAAAQRSPSSAPTGRRANFR